MYNKDGMFKMHSQEEVQKLYDFHKKCYESCLNSPRGDNKRNYLLHHNGQMNWAVRLGAIEK